MKTYESTRHETEDSDEIPGARDKKPETWPELKEHLIKTVNERAEFLQGSFFPLEIKGFRGFFVSNIDPEKHRAQIIVSYSGHLTFRIFRNAEGAMQMVGDKIPPFLGVSKKVLLESICETLERFNPNLWVFLEDPGRDIVPTQINRKPGTEASEPVPVDERRLQFFQSRPGLECAIATGAPSKIDMDESALPDHLIEASGLSGYCHFVFPKGVISDSAICANAPYFFRFANPLSENTLRNIVLDRSITKEERREKIKKTLEGTEFFSKVTEAKRTRIANGERYAARHPDIDADETIRDKWYGELQEFIENTLR